MKEDQSRKIKKVKILCDNNTRVNLVFHFRLYFNPWSFRLEGEWFTASEG